MKALTSSATITNKHRFVYGYFVIFITSTNHFQCEGRDIRDFLNEMGAE